MDTSFSKISSRNGHRAYLAQSPPSQHIPWLEDHRDDWDLRQLLSIVKRRALVIVAVIVTVMAGVVIVTVNQKPEYEAKFKILVEPVNSDDKNLPKLASGLEGKFEQSRLDYETQIQVLKSPELMTNIVKQLQLSYPEINYVSLINALTVLRLGETKIIEVRYRSHDPLQVKIVLDTLAQAYLKYSLENRQTNLRQGIQFVEQQVLPLQNRVDRLQQQLQQFRQKYNFIDPETQSGQITRDIQLLTEQRLAINQQLAKARAYFINLQSPEGAQAILQDAPVYQQLVSQVRQLEVQTTVELTRFLEGSAPIQALRERRQRLLPLIRQEAHRVWTLKMSEVANEVRSLEYQSQVLAQAEQRLKKKVEELPVLARHHTELQQNLQLATESLNRFLVTRETLQIEAAQTEIPWQLVQAPLQPDESVSPNTQRHLIFGCVASVLLGLSCTLLVEKLDNAYHTIEAFKEKLKLPILATIPFEKQLSTAKTSKAQDKAKITKTSTNFLPIDSSSSTAIIDRLDTFIEDFNRYVSSKFLESLRVLHTNLQLLSSDQPIRSIVVSSASPAEGKSTIAYYLAHTACAMGQRVLLVDADLRRPCIHWFSDLNNLWGLSSIIAGNTPMETVIRPVPAMGDLSVLTSGPIPPDPTKLLSSQKMKQLMANLHKDYDLVIYDAPPILGLADANLIAPHTDGIILIGRIHKTDRSAMTQAIDNLKMSRSTVLGLVVNGHRNQTSYGYYH